MRRAGLTLMELLVVIAILAILTATAVTLTDSVVDQGRYDITRRVLDNVKTAIIGVEAAGEPITGVLANVGSLPPSVHDLASATPPPGVPLYQPYTFSLPNGQSVTVYAGWRGPYVQLAPGETTIKDGWGQNIATVSGPTQLEIGSIGNPADPIPTPISVSIPTYKRKGSIQGAIQPRTAQSPMAIEPTQPVTVTLYHPKLNNGIVVADALPIGPAAMSMNQGYGNYTFSFPEVAIGTWPLVVSQTVNTTTKFTVQYVRVTGGQHNLTVYLDIE